MGVSQCNAACARTRTSQTMLRGDAWSQRPNALLSVRMSCQSGHLVMLRSGARLAELGRFGQYRVPYSRFGEHLVRQTQAGHAKRQACALQQRVVVACGQQIERSKRRTSRARTARCRMRCRISRTAARSTPCCETREFHGFTMMKFGSVVSSRGAPYSGCALAFSALQPPASAAFSNRGEGGAASAFFDDKV